ncbi:hypothetical protein ELY38_16890 [Vreelandella nanhaiensis]|uniref:Uncharacterized protein n=1 Tax=Vreelandella nanhaiensis TaxID=1258546 RepID=A0A3S0W080_9GAMM|nr:hypothetical protein ELY38_16890 [Halomonas nanhaiensis]
MPFSGSPSAKNSFIVNRPAPAALCALLARLAAAAGALVLTTRYMEAAKEARGNVLRGMSK